LSSYSQTDTTNVLVLDTTKVTLSTKVARLVFQDLVRYDGAKLEIVELYKKDSLKNQVITLKDSQIDLFKQKIGNLELVINMKDEQFSLERQKSESLLKELKGQRTKTFFYKVGSFLGIMMTSLYLLK
jgi:low affinity Fe/Cu permease